MENIILDNNYIQFYLITSIEKNFLNERHFEFIPSKNQNLAEFKHTELFEEETLIDNKSYLNKINCISFELNKNKILKDNNNILLKIKDGTRIYLYDCIIDNNLQQINDEKVMYFLFNFEIGELRKDNTNNESIIKDSITNIQTSLIEMKQNSIPQRKFNIEEKFNFFLKAIKNNKFNNNTYNKENDNIIFIINLLSDFLKEIENNHIKNKNKIEFIKLLTILKIIYEDVYVKNNDRDKIQILKKFIDTFDVLLNHNLIYFNKIDEVQLKEYAQIIKSLDEDNIIINNLNIFVTLFYGYYEEEKLDNDKFFILSNLFKNKLYEPKNTEMELKLIQILLINSKDLTEFLSSLNNTILVLDKLKLLIKNFNIFKKLLENVRVESLPIKFEDNIKLEETPFLFYPLHKKIIEFELEIIKEKNIKTIFDFSGIIKNYMNLYENNLGSQENYNIFLKIKNIIIEEKKINPNIIESSYKYINKLIHLNNIEMVKKNILENIPLINNLNEDEYFKDELYNVTDDDYNLLNGFKITENLDDNFFDLYNKCEIWKPFSTNNKTLKKYIEFFSNKLNDVIYLEIFFKILPVMKYNYAAIEDVILWFEKNIDTVKNNNVFKIEKEKKIFFNNINIIINICIKTHYDCDKLFSFLENYFIKESKDNKNNNNLYGYEFICELYLYFINNYNIENNNSIPYNVQNRIISFFTKNIDIKINNNNIFLFIHFLNNVLIDKHHLDFEQLLNNLENFMLNKLDLVSVDNKIQFEIYNFMINKYKNEFDDKNNKSNYLSSTRKIIKNFIIKDIEQNGILYNEANILFSNGIVADMENNRKNIINKFILCSKIKKKEKGENNQELNEEKNYEEIYNGLKTLYLKCKNIIDNLETLLQYYLFFGNENNTNDIKETKDIISELRITKLKDFFKGENNEKINKYKTSFDFANKACLLKNSLFFMQIYEEVLKKLNDPNLKMNISSISDIENNQKLNLSFGAFNKLIDLFDKFNKCNNVGTFIHYCTGYFYNIELNHGATVLKNEIDFIINYFISNAENEEEKKICENFDKKKFIEYIKNLTKREKILFKCKGIRHIINIFLNPENYIYVNKEKEKLEKQITLKIEKTKTNINKINLNSNKKDWDLLDFEKKTLLKSKAQNQMINNINEIQNNNVYKNNNLKDNQFLNKINNSQSLKKLNEYIAKLSDVKISLEHIKEIIKELEQFNLGININEVINNNEEENNQNNENKKEKLIEEFFTQLIEKPEAIFYAKLKKSTEIKKLFQNLCIEIENTLLKEKDINDFILCIEKINLFSKNVEKMANDDNITDLSKEVVFTFVKELMDNNEIFLKCIINYLLKFNQIKSIINEIIASPEVSIQKINKILSNSDFIIKYNSKKNKYILLCNYYEIIPKENEIKEISILYDELENLRERILTLNKNLELYKNTLIFVNIFNSIKKVLDILEGLDRTGFPDKIHIIINVKNKKINCNYDNKKVFYNLKDLINNLIEEKNTFIKLFEKHYKDNEMIRIFYGKQISLLYNYIRYKEGQEYIDSLFQLITEGKINNSYPPKYENYSDNLIEDIINNVCNYCLVVLVSNQINEVNKIFNTNKIKIKDEKNENYKGIYLHLSNVDYSEKEILSYYNKFTKNLPLYTTILLCNSYTSEEEIISFLYRSILCTNNILFMIVNSNHLEPKQRNILLNTIKNLLNLLVEENKKMQSALVIFSTESNSEIFRALKNYDDEENPIKILYFDDIDNNLDKPQVYNLNLNNFSIVKSDSTGVGKSRHIRNLPGAFESNMIYLPLGGNMTRKSIYQRLYDSIQKLKIKNLTQVFLYIDLNQTNEHEILKEFLFEIVVFKKYSMSSVNSDKIIYLSKKFNIKIELPYESLNNVGVIDSNNYINKYTIFTLFPSQNFVNILLANLTEFYEEMTEDEKKNLINNPDFEFIKSLSDSQLQLVSKTLQLYKNKEINSTILSPTSTDTLSNLECNNLLNEFLSKVHLPNFYQKNIFIKLLFDQFLSFHQNVNLEPKNLISNAKKLKMKEYKTINEIREKIINNLIEHAVFFTNGFSEKIMKSQERTKEILKMQDYNERKKLTEELKERENISKFRYDQIHPSLLLFEKKGNNCKIIPTCQKNSDEENFLITLQKLLRPPKKKEGKEILKQLNELKYPKDMTSAELMDELLDFMKGRRISLDIINKILSEYALTPDNYIKMVLILNRIYSDIPVILMGETGCGKTSLIKILANIIFKGNLTNLKILNIHSGIEDNEIIQFLEQIIRVVELEDSARLTSAIDEFNSYNIEYQNKYLESKNKTKEKMFEDFKKEINQQKIWVFFDEINASNSMGLLSEILCKKTYLGKKIPPKFVFLAACNPYRAMGELNKIDHTLIHKGQEKRKLVYTVYPLPNNMLNFVLDFGNLSLEEEKKYIEVMIKKMMEKIMIDKSKKEKEKIINLAINSIVTCQSYIKNTNDISSVSLREVKRFMIFFKYFVIYLLNKQNDKQSKDQSTLFYLSKNNYELYKYAVNLSLYICYYLRLPDIKSRNELLKYLDNEKYFNNQFLIVPQLEENYIAENILQSKENEALSKGIAKNRALLENLFSLYFCTVNKIPLIICGKPGSTKSLSQKLLQNALKGTVSGTKLCKETKELVVFQYQGSLNSTSDEIKQVFKKAKNYQKSNKDTIVMVYIDEMGLAEISKNNPLKAIHSELEMNFDFEIDNFGTNLFNTNENSKVAFLGISNWSLDASKMNRAIFNVIQEPDIKDLKKTALEISSSIDEQISNKYITFFDKITAVYYEYIEQKKRDDRIDVNFHGLRDFYNLIKSTTRELSILERNPNKIIDDKNYLNNIAIKYIERNFGGLPTSVYEFKKKYYSMENDNKINIDIDSNYNIMQCISENIFDKESRYLLLITKNNLDLDLINFLLDEIIQRNNEEYMKNKFERKYLIGSNFIKDNDEEYRENILSLIRDEMKTNNLLILKNLDIIYTSLYDLLNQDFTKIENNYYTRISFGLWKPLSLINKKFKLIVIINENNLCYEDPPFLNRFEKHIFSLDNLLDKEQKNMAKDIYNLIISITQVDNCKINLRQHLININLEELEALVYKFYKEKKYVNKNIDIIYEILKKIVPTFPEEIIASIFVSGFKEQQKNIAEQILDIYDEYHPSNLCDFLYNKMTQQKNIIYTYSVISDNLTYYNKDNNNIIYNNKNKNNNKNNNIIYDDINKIIENDIDEQDILYDSNSSIETYVESIKSALDLEKLVDEFLNEENKNLFVLKFSNKEKDLNKMNQISYLIDDCLSKNNNNNIKNKYFIFIIYLIKEENEIKKEQEKNKNNLYNILSSSNIVSKLSNNCHHVFIDNLNAKHYNFIKTLTLKNNDLFEFFFIDELHKNIDTSFRFMTYEFSKNETNELNSKNYREKMTQKILENKYIQNILQKSLLKLTIGTKEILKRIFFEDEKKNKKKNNKIVYNEKNKGYTDFIEMFKEKVFEHVEFYLIKIIYCLEKSQILHCITFNNKMLKHKLINEKIIKYYIDNELQNQLTMNKISTNFNMKNKLNVILNIKIPYISKNILIGKIFKYIKDEIVFNYSDNESKLMDVIKDNSLIEETINDYFVKLNQLNENIYNELINQEIIKDIIYSNDKYLITSLYEDFLLLFLLDGKKFENGDNFQDFYRFMDILIQLRFLNIKDNNFSFTNENKTINLLKINDILFNNNINDKNKNKAGLMLAKILGFIFAYQNEINILLEIFSYMNKYIPNLIKIFEDIIVYKEVKNEITERNPDYCRIVKESFFIVYESLLHCITSKYNKYNILKQNINNKINLEEDSDLEEDDDEIKYENEIDGFSLLNNNIIIDNNEENLLKELGDIPIENIEKISKISDLLEKKMLLYSKKLFMIKNLSKIFVVLNKIPKDQIINKENIIAITNIICSEEKYIYENNYKFLFSNFLLLMELLGKILNKDSKEYGELIIYLIYNQFLNIKNISYKTKILNYILPDIHKKTKTKKEMNPIIIEKSLPLLILLFNNGIDNSKIRNNIEPIYDEKIAKKVKIEKFLNFVKNENNPNYKLLKIINRQNKILDQILMYYFEYLSELYFEKIRKKNEGNNNIEEEIIGNTSLDYLEEALLFLDDEINGNNNLGNKINYLNKIGKLFCISYIKKYINNYVYINKNNLHKVFIWEDINNILYGKDNKYRRMIKYYILKQYCKMFDSEKDFVNYNFNNKKIPFSSKFQGFKLELNKKQFEYNIIPSKYLNEYKQFYSELSINNFNVYKFYDFIIDKNNINSIDLYFCFFVNNFLLQNFYNDFYVDDNSTIYRYLKEKIYTMDNISEEARNLLKLLEPNEFFKSVKTFMGNKLTLKQYEIFIYALRICLISKSSSHYNFYSNLLTLNCFNTLSENFIPGKTASRNIYAESYEIIKENLLKDPLSYGAYICSCGYHYSVANCTFPTVISKCPICNEDIGGTNHILVRRPGHMRIFLNDDTRRQKFSPSYADKGMNNMLLDDFYKNIVLKQSDIGERYIDKKRPIGCNKEDFLKREKVRGLEQIPFRILNFVLFSHLFISRALNFISDDNLSNFKVKDMSIFESLEIDWDILDELLKEKKIKNVQIFLNILYPNIYQLIDNCQFFENDQKYKIFESLFQQKIEDSLKNTKEIKDYEKENKELLCFEPLSDMAIIYEKFPPHIYKKDSFPDMELFLNSKTPTIDEFKKKFIIISNPEDKYPLLKIILTQDMEKIELLKEIPKLNKLANYLLETCSFKYSRESANNTKIKTELIYNEIKEDIINFINSWNKIRPIIENYGCKQFKNNGIKYFTELNTNSPISHFFVDEGEFGHGMVLAAIYKKLIEIQNTFLNQIINSKSEILSCFKEQLNQEIMIQDATVNEIIDLNKINNDVLTDIIVKNSIPNIFKNLQTEKKIDYYNIKTFEHDYENIERELGSLLLPGLRRFKPDEIRFIMYKYEGFRGKKSSIITNFNEKYPQRELNKEQVKYIFNFINKEDINNKKNNNNINKKNIKKILFSLQLLIDYIQRENYDKMDSLYDIIIKLPNHISISDELKQFFKINKNNNINNKEGKDFNLLSNNNDNNNKNEIDDNIYFSINTLISIFELFEHLCWESLKENLVGDYLQKIDPVWGRKIITHFDNVEHNQGKIIKKIIFCTALRRFISRYLTGKRGENEINENNTLLNEIVRPELWKPFFTESDSFDTEIAEIMSVMTDEYDGSLKVGQTFELYNLLGGDNKLLDNAKNNFQY